MALARVWLDEIKQVGNLDDTAALFSESTGRVLVSVGREDDVKFVALCEARGIPVLRIGVADGSADTAHIEIQASRRGPSPRCARRTRLRCLRSLGKRLAE